MTTADNVMRAEKLARLGLFVFPVYVTQDPENPYKTTKKPGTPNGFYDASNDPGYMMDLFAKHPNAEIGVWMGPSMLNAADLDVKRSPDGEVLIDGFDAIDDNWLDLPDTHSFDSISGAGGKQYIYSIDRLVETGGTSNYRGMKGVDRRWGNSYSVWNGPIPQSRDDFKPAPEWLMDEMTVRSAAKFEGDVKDWYETLEEGEPSLIVRAAMDRTRKVFEDAGNDFDHSTLVERQYEAVRLGAEGATGVPQLLSLIEELFFARTGSHSRSEDEWPYEFAEALASGVAKYGDAISLRKELPEYNLLSVPATVPENLLVGEPGDAEVFRNLLRSLLAASDDDIFVTGVLWNCPRTRDISREWGLSFVHKRVTDARQRPEPVRENPTLPAVEPSTEVSAVKDTAPTLSKGTFLSAAEWKTVQSTRTFIDKYLEASESKGFSNEAYAIPAAWTALSMAMAFKAVIPKGVNIGMNLWFLSLGYSGTGKSSEMAFLKYVLDNMLKNGNGYYNLGAMSSPEGILLELLTRDGLPSMIFQDEASSFFEAMKSKDWFKALEYDLANYYMGDVPPSNKISLKDFRGKSATTSFHQNMIATPDRLLKLINTEMFATGFMARYNWTWADMPEDSEAKYEATRSEINEDKNAPSVTFDLASDLIHARNSIKGRVDMWGTEEAVARLEKAHADYDRRAKKHEKYEALEPAITRLGRETTWKCAALLALYRGVTEFDLTDVLVALKYADRWYVDLVRAVEATSESDFAADAAEIEAYIKVQGGEASEAKIHNRFRNMIRNTPRELYDRLDFLVSSGRVLREDKDRRITYRLNGTTE